MRESPPAIVSAGFFASVGHFCKTQIKLQVNMREKRPNQYRDR
jgi:hypothetical protein